MTKVVEEIRRLIEEWMEESEREIEKMQKADSWFRFKISFVRLTNLSAFYLNNLTVTSVKEADKISNIALSAQRLVTGSTPETVEIEISEGERTIIDINSNKETRAKEVFPTYAKTIEVYDKILETLEKAPVRFLEKTQDKADEAMNQMDLVITELEKKMTIPDVKLEMLLPLIYQTLYLERYFKYLESFDSRSLVNLFKNSNQMRQDGKIYQYKIKVQGFGERRADFGTWYLKNILDEDMKARFKGILSHRSRITEQIKERGEEEGKIRKLMNILEQMDPEFPVNLPRLAELGEMGIEETEQLLITTLNRFPNLGKYNEMSQMLIFNDSFKKKMKKEQKKVKCPECKSEIKSTMKKCPNCGKEFELCEICKGIIISEKIRGCSSCGRLFHKNHLEEWMNANRDCPVCKNLL